MSQQRKSQPTRLARELWLKAASDERFVESLLDSAKDRPDLDSFAGRMRLTRTAKGLSQGALADLLGMKRPQVNRYEAGRHTPRSRTLAHIAAALDVRPEWLATGIGPRHLTTREPRRKPLKVSTAGLHEGGTEVTFVLSNELREVFSERAKREGISLVSFLTNALLDLAKERGDEGHINELARRLNMLLTPQAAAELKTRARAATRAKKRPAG